jgi:hypothetical protein
MLAPCPARAGGDECSISRICWLRGMLDETVDAFHGVLDRCTLADLVHDGPALADVFFVPPRRIPRAGCETPSMTAPLPDPAADPPRAGS